MANDDDPNAPYKLYDGDKLIGTFRTRAEARRKQQQLEGEAGSEQRLFTIKRTSWIASSCDSEQRKLLVARGTVPEQPPAARR
jgi:hypothetical protein